MIEFNRSLFIDCSKPDEIRKWHDLGSIDGVTTNQMIMLKDGISPDRYEPTIKDISKLMEGKPVSVELTDSTVSAESMIAEAKRISILGDNIVVKVPLIPETTKSLEVIRALVEERIAVNVTTMMTYEQMIMAALVTRFSSKLSFISLFWARSLEDHERYRSKAEFASLHAKVGQESEINSHPKRIVMETARFLKDGDYVNPKIIVGSIRNASMVGEAFAAGANIVTVTPEVLQAMLYSKRSIETISEFDDAWTAITTTKS